MPNQKRVDKTLFRGNHYLGKPAAEADRIIGRRIALAANCEGFFDSNSTCLEVGCGEGATITRIAQQFKRCKGIDIYDYAAQFEELKQKHQALNCTFEKVDLETNTFTEKFDRLVSFEVIEHFKNEDTVGAFARILTPAGLLVITVPNKWWVFETHGARLPLLPWNRVPLFSWLPTIIHERYANARIYTRSRIVKLLKKHGFEILRISYVTAPMDVLKEGWLKRIMLKYIFRNDTTRIPFLSTSIFVFAKKSDKSSA